MCCPELSIYRLDPDAVRLYTLPVEATPAKLFSRTPEVEYSLISGLVSPPTKMWSARAAADMSWGHAKRADEMRMYFATANRGAQRLAEWRKRSSSNTPPNAS